MSIRKILVIGLLGMLGHILPTQAKVMGWEDKLISMVTLVQYGGKGGLIGFSQEDYLMLLDTALQQGYKPSPALLKALADQPELLTKTQQRAKVHQ